MLSNKPTVQLLFGLAISLTLAILSTPLMAEEADGLRISKSINFIKTTNLDKSTKDTQLKETEADIMLPLVKSDSSLLPGAITATTNAIDYGDI